MIRVKDPQYGTDNMVDLNKSLDNISDDFRRLSNEDTSKAVDEHRILLNAAQPVQTVVVNRSFSSIYVENYSEARRFRIALTFEDNGVEVVNYYSVAFNNGSRTISLNNNGITANAITVEAIKDWAGEGTSIVADMTAMVAGDYGAESDLGSLTLLDN